MLKITSIKAAVKTPGRFNIFVDGKYSFSLEESQLLGSGIRLGKDYTEAEIEALKDESTFGKAYMRALAYIMRRPRSIKEMRDYGFKKKWDKELQERVISKLKGHGYLDDEAFANTWVRHRALGKPMSERKLRVELAQKGVDKDIIEKAVRSSSEFDENNALRVLVAKKRTRYTDEKKLMVYLMRQGYRYDDIKEVLDEEGSAT